MADPRIAHLIDAGTLRRLLPNVDQSDLYDLRREFAVALSSRQGRQAATWQEAWNLWTGATEHRPGSIRLMTKCKVCRGKGFTHRNVSRNLTRTGSPYGCGECGGVPGRRVATRVTARFAPIPEDAPDDTASKTTEAATDASLDEPQP